MLKYLDPSRTPQNGFQYIIPESGKKILGVSLKQVFSESVAHYRGNGWPVPPLLQEKIEHQDCQRHPERCAETDEPPVPVARVGLTAALNFLNVLRGAVGSSKPFVDKTEANRRAAICRNCVNNVSVDGDEAGCKTCSLLNKMVEAASYIGNKHTDHDPYLKNCAVCACFNRAQVWVDKDILVSVMPEEQKPNFPDWCWKKP